MSTTTHKPARTAGVFRVIEGGLPRAELPAPVVSAGQLPGEVEAERLRRAILQLRLPSVGLNVEQALDEICSLLEESDLEKTERGSMLTSELEGVGLRFQLVNPSLGLAREGFLQLVWPNRLLADYPELGGLHPKAHLRISDQRDRRFRHRDRSFRSS